MSNPFNLIARSLY